MQRSSLYQLCLHATQGLLEQLLFPSGQGINLVIVVVQERSHVGGAIYLTKVFAALVQGPVQKLDFSNKIMQVAEGLQQELEATEQFLEEKHKPAEEQKGTRPTKVIEVHSSDKEEVQPTCMRRLGQGKEADEASEDEPESSKQLVPFQPLGKDGPKVGGQEEYIAFARQAGAATHGGADPPNLSGQDLRHFATGSNEGSTCPKLRK
jgi:hypothetical protein